MNILLRKSACLTKRVVSNFVEKVSGNLLPQEKRAAIIPLHEKGYSRQETTEKEGY